MRPGRKSNDDELLAAGVRPGRIIDHDVDMSDTRGHVERPGTKHRHDPEVLGAVLNENHPLAQRLESLLLKDMMAWSQRLDPIRRELLLTVDATPLPPTFGASTDRDGTDAGDLDIKPLRQRALRRAEQLSNIYLDDADRAVDQDTMEFSQKLAERSIRRLASLRHLAAEPL